MKKIKLNGKLSLNKSMISELNKEESSKVMGGSHMTHCFCDVTRRKEDCIVIGLTKRFSDCVSIIDACIPRTETPHCWDVKE